MLYPKNLCWCLITSWRRQSETDDILFLDAPHGIGKMFPINLLLAKVRKQGKIANAVTSLGMAITPFPGDRTAHLNNVT